MKFKDGDEIRAGIDFKTLTNIAFNVGTVPAAHGEQLLVVMTLTLQPTKDRALETLHLTVKFEQFHLLAKAFQDQADLLTRKLVPGPGLPQ